MVTLDELTRVMHNLSKKGVGIRIEMTTINIPDHQHGEIYGSVTMSSMGKRVHRRVFHGEEELIDVLKKAGE